MSDITSRQLSHKDDTLGRFLTDDPTILMTLLRLDITVLTYFEGHENVTNVHYHVKNAAQCGFFLFIVKQIYVLLLRIGFVGKFSAV